MRTRSSSRSRVLGNGFPESHAASFALLVYACCWIKSHHPAEFLAALLNSHPLALLRERLRVRKFMTATDLARVRNCRLVSHCGIVTLRQQPETASGTIFVSLEDETGAVQVIVWKSLREVQVRNCSEPGLWECMEHCSGRVR